MSRPYVYRVTEKATGMWYIGSQYGKSANPDRLGVSYFTSCVRLTETFRADPAAFDVKVLVESDADYVRKVESSLTKMYDARNDPRSFNRYNGSQNGSPGGTAAARLKTGACGRSPEKMSADGRKGGTACYALKRGAHGRTAEEMSAQNKRAAETMKTKYPQGTVSIERRREMGKTSTAQRWKCLQCGMISTPPSIGRHQKYSAHTGKTLINN